MPATKGPLAIVSGAVANKPFNGGNAWSRLSWILGLQNLGFEVVFVEEIQPEACVDVTGAQSGFMDSTNLSYFRAIMAGFGLEARSALILGKGGQWWGQSPAELTALARRASLLFNFSGHLTHPGIKDAIACKVYYDDDPGFTQFWHASGGTGSRLDGHDFYFTIGENIGRPGCCIPEGGIDWRHTRPPVGLKEWPVAAAGRFERFTTVASWRGAYGPVSYGGKSYGLKVHEFRKFIDAPRRIGRPCEIALQIHPADQKDLDGLREHGWIICDPKPAAGFPADFQRYVRESSAEFSVAQGIYVETNSGWFSDRTVRYLASGRPALVQDTGFSSNYPVGEGLLAFRTVEEAVEGAERIVSDYRTHCRAARKVAEEYFDSAKVIGRLLAEIGVERGDN